MDRIAKRIERNLLKVVDFTLTEAAAGVKRLTPAEIRSLSDVIASNRPPAFYVLTVLANQFSFLAADFPAEPSERETVERFLTAFQRQAAADFAGKTSTLKESLELQVKE